MITEESFIDFTCPYCELSVSFPGEFAGRVQACPGCGESLVVPDGEEGSAKVPLPLKTERLVLRRFEPGDWKDLLEILSDEETFRFMEGAPWEEDPVLQWLEAQQHVRLTTPDATFPLAVELQEKHKVIGQLSLTLTDAQRQAALGVSLNRAYQRQGYGLEAVDAALGFCLEGIRLHRVTAACDSRNSSACKLFDQVGMRREGEFIKDRLVHGEWVNTITFAALRDEWIAAADKPAES